MGKQCEGNTFSHVKEILFLTCLCLAGHRSFKLDMRKDQRRKEEKNKSKLINSRFMMKMKAVRLLFGAWLAQE